MKTLMVTKGHIVLPDLRQLIKEKSSNNAMEEPPSLATEIYEGQNETASIYQNRQQSLTVIAVIIVLFVGL